MFVAWVIRVLLVALILRAVVSFIRGLASGVGSRSAATGDPGARKSVALVKDPVCGTYVETVSRGVNPNRHDRALFLFRNLPADVSAECLGVRGERVALRTLGLGVVASKEMRQEEQLRADIVEVGRRLHGRAYVASNDGNISVRLSDDRLLTTPKGVSKGFMTPDMIVATDLEGRKVGGEGDPSSEILMHLAVYQNRPEVMAVVHAHPPAATGFAVAGIPLDRAVLAEVVTTLGSIPIVEYGTPSTSELAEAVRKYIRAHDGLLLANHGALTIAGDVFAAYYKMETIEHFARISLVARLLGGSECCRARRSTVFRICGACTASRRPPPICTDGGDGRDETTPGDEDDVTCQVLQAPSSPHDRLVNSPALPPDLAALGKDGEIRLTYGELTALIEDAVKQLR